MKRLLLGWLLLLLGIGCLTQSQAFWQSRDSNYDNSSGYQGPGNIVSGAFAAWSLRAYNSAALGKKVINVCNVGDVACADLSSDPTTGKLVISTIGGSSCSVITCTVKTINDQSGGGYNMTQATIASRFVTSLKSRVRTPAPSRISVQRDECGPRFRRRVKSPRAC